MPRSLGSFTPRQLGVGAARCPHVAVKPARALDDAGKIKVGHHPQHAFADGIVRGQQRGGRKTARLIALDAADNKNHRGLGRAGQGWRLVLLRGGCCVGRRVGCVLAKPYGGELQRKGFFGGHGRQGEA